jgi:hypothetical protein
MTYKQTAVAIVLWIATQNALAGGAYIGMVKPLHYAGLYLDASATQMSGRPVCATRNYVVLAEPVSDPVFKSKFAMLLAAWLAEKPVYLAGTGNCTSEGDEIIYVVGFP